MKPAEAPMPERKQLAQIRCRGCEKHTQGLFFRRSFYVCAFTGRRGDEPCSWNDESACLIGLEAAIERLSKGGECVTDLGFPREDKEGNHG